MWGTVALFPPIVVSGTNHPQDLADRTLKIKRLRGLFYWNLIPVILFCLSTYQFAKSEVFATYQAIFIAAFKVSNNVLVGMNRGVMQDDLYVLPFYGGMSLVTMLITIKVGAFTAFLTGYLTQIFIKIGKRTFVEPYQLTIKDWIQRLRIRLKLGASSDPADTLPFKDRVYIEQINSLGQNSVEFIAAWLFPVLIVFNYFFHEELKMTIARDFLKYFIVFSFIQACAEVCFDVFLNNAIECRTGRLLSVKINDLNNTFNARKCLWALSDATPLTGRRLLPSTENLQRIGLGSQHFLTQTTIIFGIAAQVYAFELWVNWGYSPFKDYLTIAIIPAVAVVCFLLDFSLKFAGRKLKVWKVREETGDNTSVEDFYEEWKVYLMREVQEKARRTRQKAAEIALARLFMDKLLSEKEEKRRVTVSIRLLKTIQIAAHEKAKRAREDTQASVDLSILPVLQDEEKVLRIRKKDDGAQVVTQLEGDWPEILRYPWSEGINLSQFAAEGS